MLGWHTQWPIRAGGNRLMPNHSGRVFRMLRVKKGDSLKTIYAKARKAFPRPETESVHFLSPIKRKLNCHDLPAIGRIAFVPLPLIGLRPLPHAGTFRCTRL